MYAAELLSEELGLILTLKADLKTDTAVLGNWLKRSRLDLAPPQRGRLDDRCIRDRRRSGSRQRTAEPDGERTFPRFFGVSVAKEL